ncbi:MAG: Iodothyronine deiodinase [Phycisphaerales bacterium]|nr:Iodothyronine deiodinase [Phycisphaerales bacterium]
MSNPMPNYRFFFITAAVMLGIAGLARAQTTRPAGGRAEPPGLQRMQERMSQLDLTEDQKVQFQAIKDEVAETIRGMGPELKNLSPEDRREKMKSALGDVREKVMSILTPEQKKKLREAGPLAQQVPGGPTTVPSTGPAQTKSSGAAGQDTPMINRMRQAVVALGLTPEQKTQVDTIFDDASKQAIELRKEATGGAKGDRKDLREKVQEMTKGVREKLAAVLTPEQQAKLKESMPAGAGAGGRGAGLGGGRKRGEKADAPATQPAMGDANTMNDGGMNGTANANSSGSNTPNTTAAKAAAVSSQAKTAQPATNPVAAKIAAKVVVGSPAPAFTATRLSGTEANNKSFTGKPLVLAFGSLTSPSFRDRLPKLELLKKKYNGRANVVVVYTKEAHPADGWQVERNRDDKVEINSPTTMKDRLALASKLKDMSKTSLDIVVDGMDDAMLSAFGGSIEGAVVLTPAGTVLGTQTFCDPSGLPRMIDDALKAKN